MMKKELKVLQIFNRYLEYGGEEGCVERMTIQIREVCQLQAYTGSTDALLCKLGGKLQLPFLMQSNPEVVNELKALQLIEEFDLWQVHNVFPAMSVAVYELAAKLGVPVVQYLHNYRFGCAGATYFRSGSRCFDCSPGNFMPAIRHRCWRGSLLASVSMVAALGRFWKNGGVNSIHLFLAISESQKRRHIQMGIPEGKIQVLPHSLDADINCERPAQGSDVLFLGRLTEEKGLMLLLRAWAQTPNSGKVLHIVGTGPQEGLLKSYCDDRQLGNVEFHGFVEKEKHRELYEQCSMVVAPSVWEEPFGMVVLEAWKHSRPILTTNIGSFPELIDHNENGWLAPTNDTEFAEVLAEALNDLDKHQSMGERGNHKLRDQFNSEGWLQRWRCLVTAMIK